MLSVRLIVTEPPLVTVPDYRNRIQADGGCRCSTNRDRGWCLVRAPTNSLARQNSYVCPPATLHCCKPSIRSHGFKIGTHFDRLETLDIRGSALPALTS